MAVTHPVAHATLVLSGIAILGLGLGSIRIAGFSLGIAGVLFSGLLFGHARLAIEPDILAFARDFGLILFVYTIGMQVGPGFFSSLRRHGLSLNLMAASVVLIGAGLTIAIAALGGVDWATAVGLFSGATTNTPALGAAQEALSSIRPADATAFEMPVLGYAIAYPFGVIGVILSLAFLRRAFRIDVGEENHRFTELDESAREPVASFNIVVENENLENLPLNEIPGLNELEIVISRIKPKDSVSVSAAYEDTHIHCGDVLHAVGTRSHLEKFRLIVGSETPEDLTSLPGLVTRRRVIVTHKDVVGKTLEELGLNHHYGVTVARVTRADIDMPAAPGLRLQFGDMLRVVGEKDAIDRASLALGNSLKDMNHTNLIPIFVGIAAGLLLGLYPIRVGEMPAPVRLGLAGGPLLAAIFLSRFGKIGPLVWYMPVNANTAMRELGIVLFLSCVGLKGGEHFVTLLREGDGLAWMGYGALITVIPLLLVGSFARVFLRMNFVNLCGMLSGSMTDPPALAFANAVNGSDSSAVSYATVYPMTMLLRIIAAQVLVLVFCR